MEKILTTIIPTYNMEKYLHRCLDSLIIEDKELFNQLEVLVVNDGSKDSSSAIAHEYQSRYPEVFRVIDKQNGNYGSCINRGLIESTGKYIKILDSDDYFFNEGLEKLLLKLNNCDSDLIVTSYVTIDENDIITSKEEVPSKLSGFEKSNIDWGKDLPPLLLSMHAFCVKKEVLVKNNYYQQEGISYTDTEFNYYCLLYSKKVLFYDIVVYKYLLGRAGQTVSVEASVKNASHFFKVSKRLLLDLCERKEKLDETTLKNVMIPIVKVSSLYFYTELFVMDKSTRCEANIKELINLCLKTGVSLNNFRYHFVNYVSLYNAIGLSMHYIYKLKVIMGR